MNSVWRIGLLAILGAMLVQSTGCGTSRTATRGRAGGEETSDQDILRLLGVEGEGGTAAKPGTPEQMAARIASLESEVMAKESQINELKAELVLKDERIEELTARMGGGGSTGARIPTVSPRNFREFEAEYNRTRNSYLTGQYRDAIAGFQQLLAVDMNNSLSDNCQYWLGECFYALKDFRQALVEFEKVLTFSNNNKDDDAQLKLGMCYVNLRELGRAKEEFGRLVTNYPESEFVSLAQSYMARLE